MHLPLGLRRRVPTVLFAALVLGAGCGSDSKVGAPNLVGFLVLVPGGMDVDLLAPPDGGVLAVPALAHGTKFRLGFDQLLDGDKIESIVDGKAIGKTDVASVTWTDAPVGAPAIAATTLYNPAGAAAVNRPAPSVAILVAPGLPSGAHLQIKVDRTKVTGKTGLPFVGPDTQLVETAPFSVSAGLKDGEPIAADAKVQLLFNNTPGMDVATHVTVTSGGAPVAVTLAPDEMTPGAVLVAPTAGAWTPGQTYAVSVDATTADLFGMKVTAPLTTTFTIALPTTDGGAPADGGSATDGASAGDAGARDGGGADAAASDGGTDAPAALDGSVVDAASVADAATTD